MLQISCNDSAVAPLFYPEEVTPKFSDYLASLLYPVSRGVVQNINTRIFVGAATDGLIPQEIQVESVSAASGWPR